MSTLVERQKALIDQYPDEYVILIGDRLYAHSADSEAIWAQWDRAWDEAGQDGPEPMVVPPLSKRRLPPPVFRGRGIRRLV